MHQSDKPSIHVLSNAILMKPRSTLSIQGHLKFQSV